MNKLEEIKSILKKNFAESQLQDILHNSIWETNTSKFQSLNIAGMCFCLESVEPLEPEDSWEESDSRHRWIFTLDSITLKLESYFDSWGEDDKSTMIHRLELA